MQVYLVKANVKNARTTCRDFVLISVMLNLQAPTPLNGQTHSNNSAAVVDELFECKLCDHFMWLALKGLKVH